MLVAGTTDAEFINEIPDGVEHSIYRVGELEDGEVKTMMETTLCAPLKSICEFDQTCYDAIIAASGKIPRELGRFAKRMREIPDRISASSTAPEKKKLKLDIDHAIEAEVLTQHATHKHALVQVVKKDAERGLTSFSASLFHWCEANFLTNSSTGLDREILRVPNFIVSPCGLSMHPTVPAVSVVYFDWFVQECRKRYKDGSELDRVSTQIVILSSKGASGGDRGNSFEKILATNLTLMGSAGLAMPYRLLDDPVSQQHLVTIKVRHRIFVSANDPPQNCFDFTEGTLLTPTDQNGGDARVDMIYYSSSRVMFIEATVSNYRTTKLPTAEDTEFREAKILEILNKWLGSDVFVVYVDRSAGVRPRLCVKYKNETTSRSTATRPEAPEIDYIVATTCPSSVRPTASRLPGLRWVKVCFLEDLIDAKIIPEDKKDSILLAQALDAGRPSL
jgi:hypothetical protein